jgi:hypothetical protein
MEMTFNLGSDIQMDFSIEGVAPVPPTPSAVTSDAFRVEDNVLTVVVTSDFSFTPDV